MEKQLIQLLLNRDFYAANKDSVVPSMFAGEVGTVYSALVEAYKRYDRSVSVDELRSLHRTLNPTMTRAQLGAVEELLQEIEAAEPIGIDLGKDVLAHCWRIEIGRQLGEAGLAMMEGKIDIPLLENLLDRARGGFVRSDEDRLCGLEVADLFSPDSLNYPFAVNLPVLASKLPNLDRGHFVVDFARPEAGKTAFNVSLAFGPGGFVSQGHRVAYFGNEEKVQRTKARAICAFSGMTAAEIVANNAAAHDMIAPFRSNFDFWDATGMSLSEIDAKVAAGKYDVVIVDQLDKVTVPGTHDREDMRLRQVYLQAREMAKRRNCLVFGVSQASADAEGKTRLNFAMLENSKTGKAAEADVIIGIGMQSVSSVDDEDPTRYLTLSKNKVSGWHGTVICMLDGKLSRFKD